MIRIFIVDDHPVVRTGLKMMIRNQENIMLAYQAGSAEEMFEIMKDTDTHIDLLIIDIALPGMSGLDALKLFKEKYDIPVLVISAMADQKYGAKALNQGADGFLNKLNTAETFINAIKDIIAGKKFYKSTSSATQN